MEEFKRKIRDEHPHLWPHLEDLTQGQKVQSLEDLQREIITEYQKTLQQQEQEMQEFGRRLRGAIEAQPGSTTPSINAQRAENKVPAIKALAEKQLSLLELLHLTGKKK